MARPAEIKNIISKTNFSRDLEFGVHFLANPPNFLAASAVCMAKVGKDKSFTGEKP